MPKKINANREECLKCENNKSGWCSALETTGWMDEDYGECKFLATKERLLRDARLLEKAIEEGRVKPYG